MKPNGRRAWRRFAKQQRRKVNRRNRQTGEPWINDADGAFYRHEQKHFAQRPTLPARPFTARSLVGMSEGAKKRLRRTTSKLLDQMQANLASLWHHHDAVRNDSFLRIGERLRPCPGCPECDHGKRWRCGNCGATKRQCDLILAEVRCKCGKGCGQWRISFPAATVCDGSGVLPARHQLCLGCSWCGTPPKEDATRFTECDGSGVLPARRS